YIASILEQHREAILHNGLFLKFTDSQPWSGDGDGPDPHPSQTSSHQLALAWRSSLDHDSSCLEEISSRAAGLFPELCGCRIVFLKYTSISTALYLGQIFHKPLMFPQLYAPWEIFLRATECFHNPALGIFHNYHFVVFPVTYPGRIFMKPLSIFTAGLGRSS
ncbi:hypothetical protein AVEN_199730-1, partial [Araneus ventricosus]